LILICGVALAADTPANVAGNWTVKATGGRRGRTINQTLVIQQDGSKISGTFQGPRQSGKLDGAVTGNTIKFHVDAKMPLDYAGTVDGDNMKGSLTGEGKTGDFSATRSK
jgi:hypothetical protein